MSEPIIGLFSLKRPYILLAQWTIFITEHISKIGSLLSVCHVYLFNPVFDSKQTQYEAESFLLNLVFVSVFIELLFSMEALLLCSKVVPLRTPLEGNRKFSFRHLNKHLKCNSLPAASRNTPSLRSFEAIKGPSSLRFAPSPVRKGLSFFAQMLDFHLDCFRFRQPFRYQVPTTGQ